MRIPLALLLAAAIASPAATLAQPRFSSVGLAFGSTSDFGRGLTSDLGPAPRQFSVGVPVRARLTGGAPLSLGLLGTFEWSYASAAIRGEGLRQVALGPELRSGWGAGDLRLAGLFGLIQRRGDAADASAHQQYGVEVGAGLTRNAWRIGYSYRAAWVQDVPHVYPDCATCRNPLWVQPPTTEQYDRHALTLSWQR